MRTSTLLPVALLATTGATLDAVAWTRDLNAHNPLANLVARAPKGGGGKGGGGGGGSSGGDDDDEDSVCTTGGSCDSGKKSCGDYCIPDDAVCCPDDYYCSSGDTCVRKTSSENYACCPENDSSCDADDLSSTMTKVGDFQLSCDSGASVVKGAWALGALGVVVALGA